MKHTTYIIQYADGNLDLDIHFFMEGKQVEINSAIDESACDVINLLDDEDVIKIKNTCKEYVKDLI